VIEFVVKLLRTLLLVKSSVYKSTLQFLVVKNQAVPIFLDHSRVMLVAYSPVFVKTILL